MKTEKSILTAFILNLAFSIFEFWGGVFTGSVGIVSDAIHDFGDAAGIGISFFLEKKSKKEPDEIYTYGYVRYSVIGSIIISFILIFGLFVVIYSAVKRMINPCEINYEGMIVFAIVGVCVNLCAAYFTCGGDSLNQKAVNLHMLEDVLGWIVVLLGAIVMHFTDWSFVDSVMSIGVSVFVLVNAVKNLKESIDIILEKTPHRIDVKEIVEYVSEIDGVLDVHHIHIWSLDGQSNCATMHIVTDSEDFHKTKEIIRAELHKHSINHVTLELESGYEHCHEKNCYIDYKTASREAHHHHC